MVKCMGEIRIKRDVSDAIVYGIHIDPNIQDPLNAVTYLEDAVGMTPASMGSTSFNSGSWADAFFIPKPCMVRYDGTVDYYLDPSDYSKKADGTASDIADPNYAGNAMMEWGLIWFKFEPGEADGEGYFYVSNKKVNDSFNCWCNYDANNNITQHFYTAIYNGTGIDKLRSISGVQLTSGNGSGNTTGQQEITRATANNTSDLTEWYIDLFADRELLTGLLYLMGKSLNLQATFGRGLDSGGYTAKNAYVTGTLNDKGLFWGDTAGGNNAVKVFGMENFWGCCWHRTAGLFGTEDGYAYKLTHGTIDGSTATEFGTNANGYIPINTTKPETGFVTKMLFGKHGILPSTVGGSASTYYSDYFIKGNNFAMVGGNTNYGLYCGSYLALHQSVDSSDWSIATSLSLRPRAKTPYNPDWVNKPAHQFTNGQWMDIPTHHFINGRWQGELTSQSPLKFRADGEMLDWRVEGRTSGNLYDIGLSATDYTSPSYTKLTISNDTLSMKLSSESGMTYAIRTQRQTRQGAVTFALDTDCNIGIGIIVRIRDTDDTRWLTSSDTSISGFTYNNVYSGWYRWTPLNNGHPIQAITVPNAGSYYYVGFLFAHSSSAVGNVYSATNIQLLEGTYTADTLPPYEPYGGVGDWDETEQKYRIPVTVNGVTTNLYTDHQLMDGDSIGYATTETEIPLAMGNNTLTVDTAVKPSKVFVKFEG